MCMTPSGNIKFVALGITASSNIISSVADGATASGDIISVVAGGTAGGNIISLALIGTAFWYQYPPPFFNASCRIFFPGLALYLFSY